MSAFGNTLIIGAGPAAIQVAVAVSRGWSDKIGMVNRKGGRTVRLKRELEQNGHKVSLKGQGEKYGHLTGEAKLHHFYEGYDCIEDIWQTIVLCTPSDSYKEIVHALKIDAMSQVKTIILLSPGIGSNLLVNSQLPSARDRMEVISLSNYFAATKFESAQFCVTSALTKALKKRIYIASSRADSSSVYDVQQLMGSLGVQCTVVGNAIEAESRNITTYVHPPFFINDFSLHEILGTEDAKKSMYKIYPEGPITQHSIRTMVLLWKEISALIDSLGAQPLNLLQFLNDDNYPVHEITLSREDIENFPDLPQIKQEYLLYIRYSAILIDPFSTPDENGKYFDFSSVPYKKAYQDENGKWVIPRIPYEDYKKCKLLYALAQKMNVDMPQTLKLLQLFEHRMQQFIEEKGRESVHPDMLSDTIQDEADAIFAEMGRRTCKTV